MLLLDTEGGILLLVCFILCQLLKCLHL